MMEKFFFEKNLKKGSIKKKLFKINQGWNYQLKDIIRIHKILSNQMQSIKLKGIDRLGHKMILAKTKNKETKELSL